MMHAPIITQNLHMACNFNYVFKGLLKVTANHSVIWEYLENGAR